MAITIYDNPNGTHANRDRYYARSDRGYGSYGSTPDQALEYLDVVGAEYAAILEQNDPLHDPASLVQLATERVQAIIRAGGQVVEHLP